MTAIITKIYLIIFLPVLFIQCNNKADADKNNSNTALPKYELDEDWPLLAEGFALSAVSAVDIDTSQNVFLFQRTNRDWTRQFPDSLISANTIFMLDNKTGTMLNSWGANMFIMPHGLAVDKDNNIWVTDVGLQQIFKFSHDGKLLMKLGVPKTSGNDSLHFNLPTDVAEANDGSFYVSDGYGNSRVVKFSRKGKYLFEWGNKGDNSGEFNTPHSIDLDSQGNVYVADRENNRIQKFDANGIFIQEWKNNAGTQLYAISIDKMNNNLFAIDNLTVNDTLIKGADIIQFDSNLNVLTRFGRSDSSGATVPRYHDIVVDNSGNIYVTETSGKRIRKFKKASNK